MARRFGGKYSPTPQSEGFPGVAPGREVTTGTVPMPKLARRVYWLIVAAVPFLFSAFGTGPVGLVRGLGAFALVAGAAFLLREGLRAEAEWNARDVARRPALPRKILGAVTFGLGLAIGAQATSVAGAAVIGSVGTILVLLAFRPDPLHDKGIDQQNGFQHDRATKAVTDGQKRLDEMRTAIQRTGDRALIDRVNQFAQTAGQLFRAIERDPADLGSARRYTTLYLQGARDASVKFADLWIRTADNSARAEYEALLTDLEANYTARVQSLTEGGRTDLSIEIDVLRERLQRDGLAPPDVNGH